MAVSSEKYATVSSATTSDWVWAYVQCQHTIDVDLADTVSAVTYTIETTDITTGSAKKIKKPNDVDTDWVFDEAAAIEVAGKRYYRLNVSAYTGTGNVTIRLNEVEITN